MTDPVPAGAFASDIDNQDPDNYLYDDNGNMQQDLASGIGFVLYDIHNLPVTLYKTNGTQYQFASDVQGNRVRKAQGTATYPMYFNGADGKTELVVASVISSTYNMWGSDMLGQLKRSPGGWSRYYYLKDHLGNIRVTVDGSGNVTGADDYYPFGMQMEGRSIVGSADARYKFTGKERDAETSYDYFGARYYDARIGRFLTIDRFAVKYADLSPYSYAASNPIIFVDVNGDSLIVTGSQSAIDGFTQISNQALGGFYTVNVDPNGLVSVAATGQQGTMSDQQQAFLDALMGAASLEVGTISVGVEMSSEAVLIGSYDQGKIDVGDIAAFGNGPGESAAGMMGHELAEQTQKQLNGMAYPQAHQVALSIEARINGSVLIGENNEGLKGVDIDFRNEVLIYSGESITRYREPGIMSAVKSFFGYGTMTISKTIVRNNVARVSRSRR